MFMKQGQMKSWNINCKKDVLLALFSLVKELTIYRENSLMKYRK